jgi:hypothetical protein
LPPVGHAAAGGVAGRRVYVLQHLHQPADRCPPLLLLLHGVHPLCTCSHRLSAVGWPSVRGLGEPQRRRAPRATAEIGTVVNDVMAAVEGGLAYGPNPVMPAATIVTVAGTFMLGMTPIPPVVLSRVKC